VENTLDFRFLGPPEIFYAKQPIKFATRKTLALLAMLVAEPGFHPREQLTAIFWPESTTHLAQSSLRNTLVRIKKALRDVASPLCIEADRIGFNISTPYTLDLELINQALSLEGITTGIRIVMSLGPTSALLPNAAAAIRGDFLDGFSLPDAPAFEDWMTQQRVVWERRMSQVFERIALQQMEARQFESAIATVTRWIKLERLNEGGYRLLMQLQFLNDDAAAAHQTYVACQSLLARELGVEPAPRTIELLSQIRSTQLKKVPAANSPMKGPALPHIPFLGRIAELQRLTGLFYLAQSGLSQVGVVKGETGSGKTRLGREFLKWVAAEGADVLSGRAFEASGRLPYQAVIDALRYRLDRENAPEDLLDDTWLVELTAILPELRERYPDLTQVLENETTSRARLFEAITRLSQALASRRPLVWLIDDVQLSDTGTRDLLHYLVRRWSESLTPAMLLILLDQDAAEQELPLLDWLTRLNQAAPVTHITLPALSSASYQQLVEAFSGENSSGMVELATWLSRQSSGQPLFLAEILLALQERGLLVWVSKGAAGAILDPLATMAKLEALESLVMPGKIHEVILTRLKHLDPSAAALLGAAAVLNHSCTFDCLLLVAGIDESQGLNALDRLVAARLLLEACDESQPYSIPHEQIRQVVYTELHQAHQQVFHRRALSALADAQAPAAELAYHALAAQEWQASLQYSLAAGDEARRISNLAIAAQHYETALNLLRQSKASANSALSERLYTSIKRVYEIQGLFKEITALEQE
jgi:DNA-binding SARP family transcriptional activator